MEHPRIIYWKWNDRTVADEGVRRAEIEDLCRRSCFSLIYISLVWCKQTTDSEQGRAALADATEQLRALGRGVMLDIDIRPCRERFAQDHPEALLGVCTSETVTLDAQGRAAWETGCAPSGDHYGNYPVRASRLAAAFSFVASDNHTHQPGSLARIDEHCRTESRKPGQLTVQVDAPDHAGREVTLYASHTLLYPDPFADETVAWHDRLLDRYADLPLAGAAIDEWGMCPYPGFGFGFAWRDPWHSPALERRWRDTDGNDYLNDCFCMVRPPADRPALRDKLIRDYYDLLRERNGWVERHFYDGVKRRWGGEAFVGVHPTWYAIEPISHSAFELWKNGFDWWEVPRDYGQTDEHCPFAIRTSLARRCGGAVWYNMWYGLGSHDVATYLREIRLGIRFGGRVHALGYACPNESEVMELGAGDALETVSTLIERVALLDRIQDAQLDCRLLIVMGHGAACNWTLNAPDAGHWAFGNDILAAAYQVANGLWAAGWLCDFVPSTELAQERLVVEDGRAVYRGHHYDGCVVVGPEFAEARLLDLLAALDPARLFVCGGATRDRDGEALDATIIAALDGLPHRSGSNAPLAEVEAWAAGVGLVPLTPGDPTRFVDGLYVFSTTNERAPAGQPLAVDATLEGHTIQARCEDFLAVGFNAKGEVDRLAAPRLASCHLDGRPVLQSSWGQDVAWRAG